MQGCGKGQGGSRAAIQLFKNRAKGDPKPEASVEFEDKETGHIQDFRWRHIGKLCIQAPGAYWLELRPIAIKNGAMMDIRRIDLVRLPDAHKQQVIRQLTLW